MTTTSLEEKLADIDSAPVEARWRMPSAHNMGPRVSLFLPHLCFFRGNTFIKADRRVVVGSLRVADKELRGHNIGARLTRSLGALAQKYCYTQLAVPVASQYSLDIFESVFGKDRLSFYGQNGQGRPHQLSSDIDEIRALLVAFEQAEDDLEHRRHAISTIVSLEDLDLNLKDMPLETAHPDLDWSMVK